jgi:hypothetical protein
MNFLLYLVNTFAMCSESRCKGRMFFNTVQYPKVGINTGISQVVGAQVHMNYKEVD